MRKDYLDSLPVLLDKHVVVRGQDEGGRNEIQVQIPTYNQRVADPDPVIENLGSESSFSRST